jgi:two-component system OmpR family response regulator
MEEGACPGRFAGAAHGGDVVTNASAARRQPAVSVVHWPQESDVRKQLQTMGLARLLLVGPDSEPPAVTDALEDWIREPVDGRDLEARLATLGARAGTGRPRLDGRGRIGHRDRCVALSPIEHELASILVGRFGRVVEECELVTPVWGSLLGGSGAFRVHLTRLRRRLAGVGLEIHTVRTRGYVLQEMAATTVSMFASSLTAGLDSDGEAGSSRVARPRPHTR